MATEEKQENNVPKKLSGKKLGIFAAAVILALAVGIGIYNTPANRLSRQLDLGQKYLLEQNYEQAIVEFDKAIAIDPMNVDAYLGKADAYIGLNDYENAVEALEAGYACIPENLELEEKLVDCYLAFAEKNTKDYKNYEKSLDYYNKIKEIKYSTDAQDSYTEFLKNYVDSLLNEKAYDGAMALVENSKDFITNENYSSMKGLIENSKVKDEEESLAEEDAVDSSVLLSDTGHKIITDITQEDLEELKRILASSLCIPFWYEPNIENVLTRIMTLDYQLYFPDDHSQGPIFYMNGLDPDPLGRFPSDQYEGYSGCNADNCDWILSNIFHLVPDRASEMEEVYYYEGDYYHAEGGMGWEDIEITIINYIPLSGGKYYIEYEKGWDGERYEDGKFVRHVEKEYLVADLEEIDGGRYWTYYEASDEPIDISIYCLEDDAEFPIVNSVTDSKRYSYTDTELIQMAEDYYYRIHGYKPPIVEIDSRNGNDVRIHFYEITGGHTATYDWYIIDANSGKGTDFDGNKIDITK